MKNAFAQNNKTCLPVVLNSVYKTDFKDFIFDFLDKVHGHININNRSFFIVFDGILVLKTYVIYDYIQRKKMKKFNDSRASIFKVKKSKYFKTLYTTHRIMN